MRRFAAILLACCLFGAAAPARACINDSEVNRAEREFKSSYDDNAPAPGYTPPPSERSVPLLLLGAGSALLVGACGLSVKRAVRSR